jgi:GT2 family glycosyltransferase
MNLWLITVNYIETESTSSLIDSLLMQKDIDGIKIGIANNASSENSSKSLKKIKQKSNLDIKIVNHKKNYYYWPAIKKMISNFYEEQKAYPDWVLICNNDITFPDKNFFSELKKIDSKKYPIIGPKIINSSGLNLNPFMVKPLSELEKIYWKIYFISYPISIIISKIKKLIITRKSKTNSENLISSKQVYAIHGSAMLLSNHFFERGGFIDDNFEMYGEEVSIADTAKKIGLPITYLPKLLIIHNEHTSTKKVDNKLLFLKARESYKYNK